MTRLAFAELALVVGMVGTVLASGEPTIATGRPQDIRATVRSASFALPHVSDATTAAVYVESVQRSNPMAFVVVGDSRVKAGEDRGIPLLPCQGVALELAPSTTHVAVASRGRGAKLRVWIGDVAYRTGDPKSCA